MFGGMKAYEHKSWRIIKQNNFIIPIDAWKSFKSST